MDWRQIDQYFSIQSNKRLQISFASISSKTKYTQKLLLRACGLFGAKPLPKTTWFIFAISAATAAICNYDPWLYDGYILLMESLLRHDDVIKWKYFLRYWPFVWGIHRSPVNSPHKGQWRGALMFSGICALNKRLSKQSWGWWFEAPSRSLWRHCNECW